MTKGDFEAAESAAPQPPSEDSSAESGRDSQVEEEASAEASLETQLAERTADLQRLQAEYVNYRKRVERDRAHARSAGEAAVLRSLLTVLDDLGRAEKHGELEGGFKAVADSLHQAVKAHRLESFGAPGEVFDPKLHEALFHAGESDEVEATTIESVVRTGYRVGDHVIRHAQVGVVDPASVESGSVEPGSQDGALSGDAIDEGAPSDEQAQGS